MLDYGSRSKCCYAPIRLGFKTIKKTHTRVRIWICTRCGSRDVDIVPKGQPESQVFNSEYYPDDYREE